ncbi:MAG: LamG domain-containing protein, partial [Chthoniobacteraceae bacterium]
MCSYRCLLTSAVALLLVIQAPAQIPLGETWQSGYSGADAEGPQVLGYWKFASDAPTVDSSGKGHTLTFAGARAVENGKRDGALECFPGFPVEDKRHGAMAEPGPGLSPKGAFTVEMWIRPKPQLTAKISPVLLDKKYVAHADYQFRLTTADGGGARRMEVLLGFGSDSETFISDPFVPGTDWQHVAFTYDAAGEVRFFRNGTPLGSSRKPGRGSVTAGRHGLSIGDRVGSTYMGFPGFIDEVRICDGVLEFRPVTVEFLTASRTWLRMEKVPPVTVVVRNLRATAATGLKLRVSTDGSGEKIFDVPELATGATFEAAYAFDTSLRPDAYRLKARVEASGDSPFVSEEATEITIVPRPLTRMPVMMWGIGDPEGVKREMARLKDLGFTHCLGGGADYSAIWNAKKPVAPGSDERINATKAMLDFSLANDFGIAFGLSPGHWLKDREELQRVDRDGKPYASRPDVNASLPGLSEFCFNVGASVAQAYREFPAWQAVLINTESRDSSQLSFSEFDHEAYRKFSGTDIPAEAVIKNGVMWTTLKDIPADHIIPDDYPLL